MAMGWGVRVLMEEGVSEFPLGEFGWDGAAGAYVLIDPKNHVSIFYAQLLCTAYFGSYEGIFGYTSNNSRFGLCRNEIIIE
jgi:CubicO group peptidase (beta-lactamase class C family)